MEEYIRKIVKEEVSSVISSRNTEAEKNANNNSKSKNCDQAQHGVKRSSICLENKKGGTSKNRHSNVQSRLSNILTKIVKTSEDKKGTGKKKDLKVQIRWIRYNGEIKQIVRPANGGGCRFVTFDINEKDPTFGMLLVKALQVFFINDKNYFGEKIDEVEGKILDSSETEVGLNESIVEFMQTRGLFASRTWFYLATRYDIPTLLAESDDEIKAILSPVKRKICSTCSHTYEGSECIICEQNESYQASLVSDQSKNENAADNKMDDHNIEDVNDSTVNEYIEEDEVQLPSIGSLRQLRVKAFMKNEKNRSSLTQELEDLKDCFMNTKDFVHFSVRRKCLYRDVMEKMKIFFQDNSLRRIDVSFISFSAMESCVDTGGPGRELFALLFQNSIGTLLHGPTNHMSFIHNLSRLENMEYHYFGQAIALSLLSGYVAPHMFSDGLASYILGSSECLCAPKDVPDADVKEKLENIEACESESEFKTMIQEFPERFDYGYLKTSITLKDKVDLLKKVAHHCIISVNMQEINQFCNGLEAGGVLTLLKKYPLEAKDLFVYDDKNLDVNVLKRLLKPEFSGSSSQASLEEDIIFNLHNFIDEVAFGRIEAVKTSSIADIEEGALEIGSVEKKIGLTDVLMFLTGSPYTDNTTQTTIYFKHQVARVTASTCNGEITFPVCDRYLSNGFSENLRDDILDSPGFGRV